MLRRFVDTCETHPDRNALCIEGHHYTYAQLAGATAGILDAIEATVASEERTIGVAARHDLLTYAATFATALSGRAFVPISPSAPVARNRDIMRQAGLRTVLTSVADEPLDDGLRVLDITKHAASSRSLAPPSVPRDALAYLMFTSGSTGTPKGVPITHANLSAFLDALHASGCEIDETDRVLQMFDLTFDFSIATYLTPLCRGACVYPVPPGGIRFNTIADLLEESELTIAPMVPSVLSYLRRYFHELRLPHVRHSYFCGEALRREILLEWAPCVPNARITNFYGPTEATVFSLCYAWEPATGRDKSPGGVVSLGRAMDGMRALVVDGDGESVRRGTTGELCLAGAQVTPGYWEDPERTKAAFLDRDPLGGDLRWYRTGDLAVEDEDGDFAFCGRLDDQVKVEGYRIELGEIESVARKLVSPAEVAAIVVENRLGNSEIHLFVESTRVDGEKVIEGVRSKLPRYMVPISVVGLESIPLSPNGKIDRPALRALVERRREEDTV